MALTITNHTTRPSLATFSSPSAKNTQNKEEADSSKQESVTLGQAQDEKLTYNKTRNLPENLASMLDESDRQVKAFMDFLQPLLDKQGLTASKVINGEQTIEVDASTIDSAKAAIAEDGEMGVKKVTQRILSFAQFAIGGDTTKIDKIRAAVELGFSQAQAALGGALPEISIQTHDAIMAEFDRWKKEGLPDASSTTNSEKSQTSNKTQTAG